LPPTVALSFTGNLLFPLLANHSRTDSKAYERALFSARKIILEGSWFLLAGLALVAPAFFRTIYKPEYADAAWMTQLLTMAMWTWTLVLSADRAVLAVGESHTLAFSNAASVLGKVVACLAGYHFAGVVGFILGLAVGNLAGHVPIVLALRRRGAHVLKQDVPYTALAFGSVGGAILVQRYVVVLAGKAWQSPLEILVALCVLVPLGVRLGKRVKGLLARR
jgi:O-antigen/teichoic acid export membrane protein